MNLQPAFPMPFAASLPCWHCIPLGDKIYDRTFGLIWVMVYAGSLLPFLYFKSGIIDPWFNLFIFLGIYRIYLYFTLDAGRR